MGQVQTKDTFTASMSTAPLEDHLATADQQPAKPSARGITTGSVLGGRPVSHDDSAKLRSSTSMGSSMSLPQSEGEGAAPSSSSQTPAATPGGRSSGGGYAASKPPRSTSGGGAAPAGPAAGARSAAAAPAGPARAGSCPGNRASYDSNASRVTTSSARSSFAADVVEVDCYGRPSFSAFAPGAIADNTKGRVFERSLPPDVARAYRQLSVLLPQAPLPLATLQQLWQCSSLTEAAELAQIFVLQGVAKMATLPDGNAWVLVSAQHQEYLEAAHAQQLPQYHAALLNVYRSPPGQDAAPLPPAHFINDGYILLGIAHHLVGAGLLQELRQLLVNPAWLEVKLHCYGVAALVEDFRRYLQHEQDALVKLVLQAFQMSLSCCMERTEVPMMQRQLLLRMQAAAKTMPEAQDWFDQHYKRCMAEMSDSLRTLAAQPGVPAPAQHLLSATASLRQAGGQHRMVLRGHAAAVRHLAISSDGRDVLTASDDGTVQVWDMDIGDCVAQLQLPHEGPPTPFTALLACDRCSGAITGDAAGMMVLWDVQNTAAVQMVQAHHGRITAIAFNPLTDHVVTAGVDGVAKLWRFASSSTLTCDWVMSGHGSAGELQVLDVAISQDGRLAATAGADFTVRIWDLDCHACVHVLSGHEGWVTGVQFLGASYQLASCSHDMTLRLWDAEGGQCSGVLTGHAARVNSLSATEDGRYLISAADDNTAQVWDARKRMRIRSLEGHGGWVNAAVLTKDGHKAVTISGDHTARLWDVPSGACEKLLEGHSDEVKALALTSRGRFLVTGAMDGTARVWDLAAPVQDSADGHAGQVIAVASVPPPAAEGAAAAALRLFGGAVSTCGPAKGISLGADGLMRIYDGNTGAYIASGSGHASSSQARWIAVAPDGRSCVTASGDRRVVRWDVATGQASVVLPTQQGSRTKSVAFDGTGARAAIVLFDSSVSVFDLGSGECISQLIRRGERDASRVHSGGVNEVLLTRDGKVAVTVSKDCTARVWDVKTAACTAVLQGHEDGISSAALSPDERMLATISYDGTARIWDMSSSVCLRTLEHPVELQRVAWSPDGTRVVCWGDGSAAYLWHLGTEAPLAALQDHKGDITGAAFSPDGAWLATCAQDSSVLLWCADSGLLRALFVGDAAMTDCAWLPNSSGGLLVGDASGQVHFVSCG